MKNKNELGIYIHIPFCVHKCIYCDFLSSPADVHTRKQYVRALINEIYLTREGKCANKLIKNVLQGDNTSYEDMEEQAVNGLTSDYALYDTVCMADYEKTIMQEDISGCVDDIKSENGHIVTSIFIGGGTPSAIDAEDISDILDAVRKNYNVSDKAEITIECNPGTMDKKKAVIYRKAGINRISFGLQSTDNNELRMLGRIHTYEQFMESYKIAREAGFDNINIDLMSALPGQTMESFKAVLEKALSLGAEHISVYSLIVEEGTRLSDNIDSFPPIPSDDEDRQMYYMTKEMLSSYGYEQYEISNYAQKGYECKHNLKYWERCDYLGFGIGAASLYGGRRYTNISDIGRYMDVLAEITNALDKSYVNELLQIRTDMEELSKEDEMSEYMFLGLRKTKGIDITDFKEEFGTDIKDIFGEAIEDNIARGLLIHDGNCLYLSKRGIDISNTVMSDFIL
jgi:putative oxygen-independent coproporphyrinogen III oxidase|uniref:radical SAM family heme chaperone HemW n=1 Tax=Lachnospira sp. TaxID=2049031 RepID=UPI003FEFBE9D